MEILLPHTKSNFKMVYENIPVLEGEIIYPSKRIYEPLPRDTSEKDKTQEEAIWRIFCVQNPLWR